MLPLGVHDDELNEPYAQRQSSLRMAFIWDNNQPKLLDGIHVEFTLELAQVIGA